MSGLDILSNCQKGNLTKQRLYCQASEPIELKGYRAGESIARIDSPFTSKDYRNRLLDLMDNFMILSRPLLKSPGDPMPIDDLDRLLEMELGSAPESRKIAEQVSSLES